MTSVTVKRSALRLKYKMGCSITTLVVLVMMVVMVVVSLLVVLFTSEQMYWLTS